MWDYSNSHLKMEDKDPFHCCTYALGGKCQHVLHESRSCEACYSCYTFFDKKVAGFLERVKSLSFKETDHQELQSMIRAIPKLHFTITSYMSHRLRAHVQFNAIHKLKMELKTDETKALIVIDHKQKILQMKYREGQVEYYGKKGMSLLGSMIVTWSTEKEGFAYHFENYVYKGYAGQDNVQVAATMQQIVKQMKANFPEKKNITIQSDNATCFASQEMIPFIFHLNATSRVNELAEISKWVFTEAQTGRGRLDTHFSYINLILKAFVEDGNDIVLEDHIFDALCFRGGISGTNVVLFNCSNLPEKALEKNSRHPKCLRVQRTRSLGIRMRCLFSNRRESRYLKLLQKIN